MRILALFVVSCLIFSIHAQQEQNVEQKVEQAQNVEQKVEQAQKQEQNVEQKVEQAQKQEQNVEQKVEQAQQEQSMDAKKADTVGVKSDKTSEKVSPAKGEDLVKFTKFKKKYCNNYCLCGIPNPIVAHPEEDTQILNRFPWVMRMILKKKKTQKFLCGITLIDSLNGVTSARCLKDIDPADVIVSLVRVTAPEPVSGYDREIKFIPHPLYDETTLENDIAIVKFNQSIPFINKGDLKGIRPVCIPSDPEYTFEDKLGYTATWRNLSGGAVSNSPRLNKGQIITNDDCKEIDGRSDITDNMICAGPYEEGAPSCQSDYGGQLTVIEKITLNGKKYSRHQLAGVASYGYGCSDMEEAPGVYTRINSYRNFIYKNTHDGCICHQPNSEI